jgi:hypothetical protein
MLLTYDASIISVELLVILCLCDLLGTSVANWQARSISPAFYGDH